MTFTHIKNYNIQQTLALKKSTKDPFINFHSPKLIKGSINSYVHCRIVPRKEYKINIKQKQHAHSQIIALIA